MVAIVGGGIAGLSLGYYLKTRGVAFTLYESAARVGGKIQSYRDGEWLAECGPAALRQSNEVVMDLLTKLKLEDEIIFSNPAAKKRYILKNGSVLQLPTFPPAMLFSSLLSLQSKWQLVQDFFAKPSTNNSPESVSAFFERHFGREVVDYLINPLVSGIYAGNPEDMDIEYTFPKLYEADRQTGSLVLGMAKLAKKARGHSKKPDQPKRHKGLISFRDGMQTLTDALATEIQGNIKLDSHLCRIVQAQGKWKLGFSGSSNSTEADQLVLCLPAHMLSGVESTPELSSYFSELSEIEYAPVSIASLGYTAAQLGGQPDGFGMLIPECEQRNILGSIYSSSVFAGRAPTAHSLMTVMAGGASHTRLYRDRGGILGLMQGEVSNIFADGATLLSTVYTKIVHHQHGIPQYNLGYGKYHELMHRAEQAFQGLHFAGSYRGGVAMPDIINNSYELAQALGVQGK